MTPQVSKEDREAVDAYLRAKEPVTEESLIEAFARHAEQARLEERERIAGMIDRQHDRFHPEHAQNGKRHLCRSLASAIRKGEGE